jgi:hypothetical protein
VAGVSPADAAARRRSNGRASETSTEEPHSIRGQKVGTYDIRRARAVRVRRRIRVTPGAAVPVRGARQFGRFASVPLVYHQVDGHFAFQTTYIPMAEIITQLVNLQHTKNNQFRMVESQGWTRIYISQKSRSRITAGHTV